MSKIIFDSPQIQVIEWRRGHGAPGVMIAPPDAGHGDRIIHYGPGKSIVNEALNNTKGGVHSICWKGATWFTRNTSVDDKVNQAVDAMALTGSRHFIGLCQAGWLGAKVATDFPEAVDSLTLAGAPIDTSLGESILQDAMDMPFYKYQQIVAANFGVMPGWLMLLCWKSANKKMHYEDRYLKPTEATAPFYAWYDKHQNLAGKWYLEIIKQLFLDNTFKDSLDIQCPVYVATGERDDITPPAQTLAILNYLREGVPARQYTCNTKHLGVFFAEKAMPMWGNIFSDLEAGT